MPYALGIDLGSGHTAAAICRNERDGWAEPELLRLDAERAAVASVLHLTREGTVEVGGWAVQNGASAHRIARGIVDRIGDEVPYSLGGQHYLAEVLAAALVGWVADTAELAEGGPPSQLVVTHPAGWGAHRRTVLQHALREAQLPEVTLLPRPVAAAESHAIAERVEVGEELAVYALGHSRFEAAIVRRGAFGFELRGHAETATELGGSLFDDLLTDHVLAELDNVPATAQLRAACTEARERLSEETTVTVPAPPGAPRAAVLVNRTDLERLIRPAVESTVQVLTRTVRTAGTEPSELRGVVLVGGCARTPLVTELVSAGLRARAVAAPAPETAVAVGAALAGTRVAKPTVRTSSAPMALAVQNGVSQHTDLMRMDDEEVDQLDDFAEAIHVGPPPPRPAVDIPPLEPPKRGLAARLGRKREADDLREDDLDAEDLEADDIDADDIDPDDLVRDRRRGRGGGRR